MIWLARGIESCDKVADPALDQVSPLKKYCQLVPSPTKHQQAPKDESCQLSFGPLKKPFAPQQAITEQPLELDCFELENGVLIEDITVCSISLS